MNEINRLKALMKYRILDTAPEQAFDEITAFAADLCGTQRAYINFIDGTKLWVKSAYGSDLKECERNEAFCGIVIEGVETLVIEDLLLDSRFSNNPYVVSGPRTRFYAGVPLVTPTGATIGTLCVCDSRPMSLTSFQKRSIERLARQVIQLLEARLNIQSQTDASEIYALLSTVSAAANESVDPRSGIQKCLDEVCRYMGGAVGHYLEIDSSSKSQLVSSGVWTSRDAEAFAPFKQFSGSACFGLGQEIPGAVLRDRATVWSSDLRSSQDQERVRLAYELGLKSAIAFPVLVKSEVVGVFEFFTTTRFEPNENFLKLLIQIGSQISRMIERAESEAQIEKQSEFLNAVLENLADGVVACDGDGKLTLFNRALREFHDLGPDAGLNPDQWSATYRLLKEDGETPLETREIPLLRAFNEEVFRNSEMVIESGGGIKRNLLASGRAMYDRNGRRIGAVCTMQDMTEAKLANRRLEAALKRFESLVETSPVGIFLMDQDCKTLLWNPGCEKIFGWTQAEVIGRNVPYFPAERLPEIAGFLKQQAERREVVTSYVTERRRDGSEIAIKYSCVPLANENGRVNEFMCVIVDVSDIRQREINLMESNRALKAATEAKSEFLANMSHEIRTPLNGVVGLTELLLDTNLTNEQRDYLKLVQSSADHLVTIISDILDFSKVEAGKLEIENIRFDLEGVLSEVHRTLEISAKNKGLTLTRSLSGEMHTQYFGDPGRIKQVVSNLVSNAIKFTSRGLVSTAVTTRVLQSNRTEVRVEVSDTGMGIPHETLTRLFKPFSQADNSTTRKFGGTGLGLSISKRLVELMGGEIGVESEPGKGSKFWFTLVLTNAAAESQNRSEWKLSSGVSTHQAVKILVAEDNSVNQMITIQMLGRLGLQADTVETGKAALQALQEKHYDLVLMDCQMPEMDGYEASTLIRSLGFGERNEVTIVALTANAMKGDREKCLAAGMDDYVTKPVKIEDLEKVIIRSMKKMTGQA